MKRIPLVLLVAVLLMGLLAAPAFAKAKPLLDFNPTLNIPGSLADGFTLEVGGTAGVMHTVELASFTTSPGVSVKDGMYPFYLKATGPQKAVLRGYFRAKAVADSPWLDPAWQKQMQREIAGGFPFFYVKVEAGQCTLVDAFKLKLLPAVAPVLTIDDDYPAGTYVYAGHLKATNGALQQLRIRLSVVWPAVVPPEG